jgi:hypothetical protein
MPSKLTRVKAAVALLAAALSIRVHPRLPGVAAAVGHRAAPDPLGEWCGRAERCASRA